MQGVPKDLRPTNVRADVLGACRTLIFRSRRIFASARSPSFSDSSNWHSERQSLLEHEPQDGRRPRLTMARGALSLSFGPFTISGLGRHRGHRPHWRTRWVKIRRSPSPRSPCRLAAGNPSWLSAIQ